MSASRQGMSFEEMEHVVGQRVANAIETFPIYESKIRMAHDSMNQVVREESTRIEVVRAHATGVGNKKASARYLPYYNKCKLHHIGCVNCRNMPMLGQGLSSAAIKQLITQRVAEAMAAYEANQNNQNGMEIPMSMLEVLCPLLMSKALIKLMTEVYCPRNEIQNMETKLWNLAMKGNDLTAYTQRFQELILLCTKMVPEEEDRVEKFIRGLPDNIQGNVTAVEPTRLQDAI
ncbi:reverse transcriptase domain-containing protein [Tanacetum coccineum]